MSTIHYLVVSAIGQDRPGLIEQLAGTASDARCNIVDTRMTILGGEFALIMLVGGSWDAIAKLESVLPGAAERLGLTTIIRRTERRPAQPEVVPYNVHVVSLDHPGIVHEIAHFFANKGMNIDDLYTGTYQAPHTGTPMFTLTMTVNVPGTTHIAGLREEFMVFCDDRNLDAIIEPIRN